MIEIVGMIGCFVIIITGFICYTYAKVTLSKKERQQEKDAQWSYDSLKSEIKSLDYDIKVVNGKMNEMMKQINKL